MYKIIYNEKVIDVVNEPRFVQVLSPHNVVFTEQVIAQGIEGSDRETLYGLTPSPYKSWDIVTIEKITPTEFNRLKSLLNSDLEVSADQTALAAAKREKIQHLSEICKNRIIVGFSIKLSDDNVYNFKLTTEDQINLTVLENQLNSGDERFIYHATNQPCRFFNKEDMIKIIRAFRKQVMYHTTYFNLAKQYIKSLTNIEAVKLFTYGTDISETVDDIVLKQILKNGENFE
jgi:hypothetical protein